MPDNQITTTEVSGLYECLLILFGVLSGMAINSHSAVRLLEFAIAFACMGWALYLRGMEKNIVIKEFEL